MPKAGFFQHLKTIKTSLKTSVKEREWTGLNRRPLDLQSNALPLSYTPIAIGTKDYSLMDSFCIFLKDKKEQNNGRITSTAFFRTGICLDIVPSCLN